MSDDTVLLSSGFRISYAIGSSAWNVNFANFRFTEFSEVACPSAPAGAAALPPLPYAS